MPDLLHAVLDSGLRTLPFESLELIATGWKQGLPLMTPSLRKIRSILREAPILRPDRRLSFS